MRALLPMLCLPLPFASLLSTDAATTLQRDELSGSHAYANVRSLCDEVGPRPAGSRGDRAAVAWATRTMQGLGLSGVHTEAVRVTHWERGEGRAELVSPFPHPLVVTALGVSVGTPAAGVEADVIEAASVEEQKKHSPDAVRGKIVFLDPIMRRTRDGAGYEEAVLSRFLGARRPPSGVRSR